MAAHQKSNILRTLLVGLVAVSVQQIVYKIFLGRQELTKDSFSESSFTIVPTPTIYYSNGNIKDVLTSVSIFSSFCAHNHWFLVES